MTNNECIKDIKSCVGCGIYEETAKVAIKALEENDKLKTEIEQLSNVNGCLVRINDKQNEEIEQLKELSFVQQNCIVEQESEIRDLKAELEQSVKLPCKFIEKKVDEYEFGYLGKGFEQGWNSCLDKIEALKGGAE